MLFMIVLSSLLTLAVTQDLPFLRENFVRRRPPCGRKCQFRFCADRISVRVTTLDILGGSIICLKFADIDRILQTGEALVSQESGNVPISKWRPDGLDPPFSPDFFSHVSFPGEVNSGIRVSALHGNQNDYLNGQCIILPIKRYERVFKSKSGRRRIVVRDGTRTNSDCIAFLPITSDIIFEVMWHSGDDLDLSVIEPDGTLVDFKNTNSECGRLRDGGIDTCRTSAQHEFITYSAADCEGRLQRGSYTVRLSHATNCMLTDPPRATRYVIRIAVDGILQFELVGSSNKDNGQEITSFKFRI